MADRWTAGVRWALREERLPPVLLWLLAADGMITWYRWLLRGLEGPLGGRTEAKRILAGCLSFAFERRARALGLDCDPRLLAAGLYRAPSARRAAWVHGVGGTEWIAAWRAVRPMSYRARWIEVATHLGEVLIVLTERLPLQNASSLLGKICYDAGVRYGECAKARWRLPKTPASAIEVLRIGEYIFRVNPEHWGHADDVTGSIEGTACPWYLRPGWHRMHCGIFGQFQSGVAATFGLKYQLTKTIPRHGGDTCKVDLVQLPRRSADQQ